LTIFKLETRTDACPRLLSNTRESMHTACVWSEKLPFAGYSVVKDHSGGNIAPRNLSAAAGRFPPDALLLADEITSGGLKPAGCSRAGPSTARRAGATQCRA